MTPDPLLFDFAASKSSLFEKLAPQARARLDRAIVNRTPAGYKEIFQVFKLADRRISYSAFYFYARRLRERAGILQMAHLIGQTPAAIERNLPPLISSHLQRLDMVDKARPLDIVRGVSAAGRALRNQLERMEKKSEPEAAGTARP